MKELIEAINNKRKLGPKKVIISSTDMCNLNCKMCWRNEKDENPNIGFKKELGFSEIKKILYDCKKLKVRIIDVTGGGEPFLREDIFELIRLIKSYGFEATLTTNATLLDEEKIEALIKLGLDDICFSIESLDKKINDSLRGENSTNKIINAVRLFNKIKERLRRNNPVLRFNTIITNKNYDRLDSLIDFAAKNNIKAINFSVLIEWDSCRELSMKNVPWDKAKKILKKLNSRLKRYNVYSNLSSIIKYGLSSHSLPKFCYAPWEILFINSRGEVLPCCILASYYTIVVGDIRKNSLEEIWFGKQMEEFREKIKGREYFDKCKFCLPEFVEEFNKKYEMMKNEIM